MPKIGITKAPKTFTMSIGNLIWLDEYCVTNGIKMSSFLDQLVTNERMNEGTTEHLPRVQLSLEKNKKRLDSSKEEIKKLERQLEKVKRQLEKLKDAKKTTTSEGLNLIKQELKNYKNENKDLTKERDRAIRKLKSFKKKLSTLLQQ